MIKSSKYASALFVCTALFLCSYKDPSHARDSRAAPERETARNAQKLVHAKAHMIVSANPHASAAGDAILKRGGSAIDAAIAAQLVLNLVEPQSSGIGGGGFLLYWDAQSKNISTFDGRETAPSSIAPDHFLNTDGSRMKFARASIGGQAVGTPGLLRMLKLAHHKHGKLPWKELFEPAIALSQNGFEVSPRLNGLLSAARASSFGPEARRYFYDKDDHPRPVGYRLKNPEFAALLQKIAASGPNAFYSGVIADDIIKKVRSEFGRKGRLSLADLAAYQAKNRTPVCIEYKTYKICGMGPPSSGALTIGQVMKLIEPYDLGLEPMSAKAVHIIAEAQKLAFADRKRFIADADFINVPAGLLDTKYLALRGKLLSPETIINKALPGNPPGAKRSSFGTDHSTESEGTSHMSIVDTDGNAVSMTTTIESAFGANIMTNGFLLNNELTDFSFLPKDKLGNPIANRIEPRKRPRSSMSPTIVLDESGDLLMITGSPGGSRIIPYVIKTLVAILDWELDAQDAANLPNFGSRGGPLEIEPGALTDMDRQALEALGHKIRETAMTSGSHIIVKTPNGLHGGADPRREGLALGE